MKRKKGIFTIMIIALAGLLFAAAGVLTAADVPDEFNIENSGYKKDKKGPVHLSHLKHSTEYGVACTECHHDYQDGKNVWKEGDPVKKCGECHDPNKSEGEIKKLQLAFHKNCKDCHKQAVKDGKEAPTTKCNDCHSKK